MKRLYAILIALILAPLSVSAGQPDTETARQFIDRLGQQALSTVNAQGAESEKQQKLQQLFIHSVDMDWMAKFVLGPAWAKADDTQRAEYLQAYRDFLLARYTTNFAEYSGSQYTITGAKNEANGQIVVNMKVKSPKARQQETLAGYRVRAGTDGQYKIVDIIIEGVSLLTTQRSDFSAVAQRNGLDKLIAQLRAKTQTENP